MKNTLLPLATSRPPKVSPLAWFTGLEYISISPNPLISLNQFSFICNAYFQQAPARILASKSISGKGFEVNLTTFNTLRFNFSQVGTTFSTAQAIVLGKWYSIGATCNLISKTARLFIDCELKATGNNAIISWDSQGALMIGYSVVDNSKIIGTLSNFHLFFRELSTQEMNDPFSLVSDIQIPGDGITAYNWRDIMQEVDPILQGAPLPCYRYPDNSIIVP